jgi:hypothetical protein
MDPRHGRKACQFYWPLISIVAPFRILLSLKVSFFFLLPFLAGCDSALNAEKYVAWVTDYDNHLHVQSASADYLFDLQYQPADYVLLQRRETTLPEAERNGALKKISDIQYYLLKISIRDQFDLVSYDAENAVEKQQREYYFSYTFQNDLSLEDDGKILPCVLYHFEKPANSDGGRNFVLGFENLNAQSSAARLVIRSDLFNSLPVKISVSKSNVPQLDYD